MKLGFGKTMGLSSCYDRNLAAICKAFFLVWALRPIHRRKCRWHIFNTINIQYSWGEGASLALVGDPSSDVPTIKMPYGVDVLHRPASHPIFSYWIG